MVGVHAVHAVRASLRCICVMQGRATVFGMCACQLRVRVTGWHVWVVLVAGWTSYHFLARSGLLGFLDLSGLLGRSVHRVPVNVTTTRGLSMLHLVGVCARKWRKHLRTCGFGCCGC
jgi:hypothetical protein